MDLAESIRENTRAVQALTLALMERGLTPTYAAPTAAEAATEAKPIKTEIAPPAKSEVTLDEVKKAAIALAKQNRDALAAALQKFGAAKVVDLKPEQYAKFLAALEALAA